LRGRETFKLSTSLKEKITS